MRTNLMWTRSRVVGAVGALCATGCSGALQPDPVSSQTSADTASARTDDDTCGVPPLPSPTLAVPAGNELAFYLDATGAQIYACTVAGAGYAWAFQAPEANLYHHGKLRGTHYAGPTWELSDGSKVVGARIAGATPDPQSIPWLLLGAASTSGPGRLADVTFIQRLETHGGIAPGAGCDASTVGTIARVPYTATYFFYKADADGH